MSSGGFSGVRVRRMHDVLAAYVERGELPGLVIFTKHFRRGRDAYERFS